LRDIYGCKVKNARIGQLNDTNVIWTVHAGEVEWSICAGRTTRECLAQDDLRLEENHNNANEQSQKAHIGSETGPEIIYFNPNSF